MTKATKPTIQRAVSIKKGQLHPNPWNPNKMTDRQQEATAESLTMYGQVQELLVRPHPEVPNAYQIIDGEHRWNTLSDNDDIYVNIIEGLSDAQAQKLTVVMDGTRGEFDKIDLAILLKELDGSLDDLGLGLPYTAIELDELVKLADVDWDSFASGLDEDIDVGVDEDNPDDDDDGYSRITLKIPEEDMPVVTDVYDLISESDPLDRDHSIAWGQVFLTLSREYLGQK